MSTYTFVDQLIGLAREYKKAERRAIKFNRPIPVFGYEVAESMIDSGYFDEESARVFGDALEAVIQASDPTYRYKK